MGVEMTKPSGKSAVSRRTKLSITVVGLPAYVRSSQKPVRTMDSLVRTGESVSCGESGGKEEIRAVCIRRQKSREERGSPWRKPVEERKTEEREPSLW